MDTVQHNIQMKQFSLRNCSLNPHLVESIARFAQRNFVTESVFLDLVAEAVEQVEHPQRVEQVTSPRVE